MVYSKAPDFSCEAHKLERDSMVERQIEARGVRDPATLKAMRMVPRHKLVPASRAGMAYADRPLPIGHGQTISQPYIVARMTELLELSPDDVVLEVGTGSGYQAAVLACIVRKVVSIEIIGALAERARDDLVELGFSNLRILHKDGYFGHEKDAPYDAIIVTAAAPHIPPPLIAQLKPGGRMVIPVGATGWTQNLILVEKDGNGVVTTRNMLPVRFVPLTRDKR
jgi:protein-L-isoaspartate(D-aspartate) O-methyltransferase